MYGEEYIDDRDARRAAALAIVAVKEAFKDLSHQQIQQAWSLLRREDPQVEMQIIRQRSELARNINVPNLQQQNAASAMFGSAAMTLPAGMWGTLSR